jgi:transposase
MRFVAIKNKAQQAARALERSRELLVRQRTQLRNSVRSQLAEFGIIAAQGLRGFAVLAEAVTSEAAAIPPILIEALRLMVTQIERLDAAVAQLEARLVAAARHNPAMRRLATIPGVGPLTAHAIVTAIGEGKQFACARDFAAWCGLTQRVDRSADKRRARGISRQGDNTVRKLLVLGASALLRQRRAMPGRATAWQTGILARRPVKVAVVAQAAKNARIAWAMLQSGGVYRPAPAAARHPIA